MKGGSTLVGYGVTCGCHLNKYDSPNTECKRQLFLGKEPMTETECRARLKAWLLLGADIPMGPDSREQHMQIMPRGISPLEEEAVYDRRAAAFAEHD